MRQKYVSWWSYEKDEMGTHKKTLMGQAIFHQFGVDYEEFETGPGNYSTAIIELPDGTVKNVPVENIAFR